jgi:hypothetical protein
MKPPYLFQPEVYRNGKNEREDKSLIRVKHIIVIFLEDFKHRAIASSNCCP